MRDLGVKIQEHSAEFSAILSRQLRGRRRPQTRHEVLEGELSRYHQPRRRREGD